MVKYQFEIDDEEWIEWKNTVPRSKSLDKRIRELIEADTDGRVLAPEEADDIAESGSSAPEPVEEEGTTDVEAKEEIYQGLDDVRAAVEAIDFPATKDREACIEAVFAAREYLQRHGSATMREFVREIMPEHSLGYDVPQLEEGERYRGAWWRKVVKPGLEALPDVEKPPKGGSDWTYSGDSDE